MPLPENHGPSTREDDWRVYMALLASISDKDGALRAGPQQSLSSEEVARMGYLDEDGGEREMLDITTCGTVV